MRRRVGEGIGEGGRGGEDGLRRITIFRTRQLDIITIATTYTLCCLESRDYATLAGNQSIIRLIRTINIITYVR